MKKRWLSDCSLLARVSLIFLVSLAGLVSQGCEQKNRQTLEQIESSDGSEEFEETFSPCPGC